jgi:Secretion system C-terminal sorting domain/Carbohydrate esterase, sialic acid-specific acetylesterase
MKKIMTIAFVFAISIIQAQITFTSVPKDLELIPRNALNKGVFIISGKSSTPGYTQIRTMIKNAANSSIIEDKTTALNATGTFSVSHQISAALVEYKIEVYLKTKTTQSGVLYTINNIVCGDVFILAGQSNAHSACDYNTFPSPGPSANINQFCRSIGTHPQIAFSRENPTPTPTNPNPIPVSMSEDFIWTRPSIFWGVNGYMGVWALKLQNDLAIETGIPSCIINGAYSGTSINQNLASNKPSNLNTLNLYTIYDRLYKKININGLQNYVKSIFWYQGEADSHAECDAKDYITKFSGLYDSWKADYPNFQKIFLFQTNVCYAPYEGLFRDLQTKLGTKYSDIITMSTIGITSSDKDLSDAIHYNCTGYINIANKIKPVVKKNIYGFTLNNNDILPPKITRSYYSIKSASANQICLEFDKNILVQAPITFNSITTNLKDFFFSENNSQLNISSITYSQNKIFLNLASSSIIPYTISYLPIANPYPNSTTNFYFGPWIMNSLNTIGALSFNDFPITPQNGTGWQNVMDNYGTGWLSGAFINDDNIIYPGDYDNDGSDELLITGNTTGNNDWIVLLKYVNNQWTWIWSNYGAATAGNGIYQYRSKFVVGDFDGNGKDELFIHDYINQAVTGGLVTTKSFEFNITLGDWQLISNVNIPTLGNKFYVGDFDGNPNGKDELLAIFSSDFRMVNRTGNTYNDIWHTFGYNYQIQQYSTSKMVVGDYDADGKKDLLCLGTSAAIFNYDNNDWQIGYNNTNINISSLGGIGYPLTSTDILIAGNIDLDTKDELFSAQTGINASWATTLDLNNTETDWNWNWSANPSYSAPFISDWSIGSNGTNTRYYLIKPKANEPKHLLVMRKFCGKYLIKMLKTDNTITNYKITKANTNNSIELETPIATSFNLFPNPNNGEFKILFEDKQNRTIKIFNAIGKLIWANKDSYENEYAINIKDISQGIYFVHITNSDGNINRKQIQILLNQ